MSHAPPPDGSKPISTPTRPPGLVTVGLGLLLVPVGLKIVELVLWFLVISLVPLELRSSWTPVFSIVAPLLFVAGIMLCIPAATKPWQLAVAAVASGIVLTGLVATLGAWFRIAGLLALGGWFPVVQFCGYVGPLVFPLFLWQLAVDIDEPVAREHTPTVLQITAVCVSVFLLALAKGGRGQLSEFAEVFAVKGVATLLVVAYVLYARSLWTLRRHIVHHASCTDG